MMKKILFATNHSQTCTNAFNFLKDMCHESSCVIDIIHVFQLNVAVLNSTSDSVIEGAIESRKEQETEKLTAMLGKLKPIQRGDAIVLYGLNPASDISGFANKRKYDFIVAGMRENYKLLDRLLGSVVYDIFMHAKCPVFSIPQDAHFKPVQAILFPSEICNFSQIEEKDESDLDWLLSQYDVWPEAKIHMLHIHEGEGNLDIIENNYPYSSMKLIHSFADSIEKGMLKYLEKGEAELLALQKSKRSFWEHLIHKSVTKSILYQSKIPVVLL